MGLALREKISSVVTGESFDKSLQDLLEFMDVEPNNVDFILDLGARNPEESEFLIAMIEIILSKVPNIDKWRSFTLTVTSFPEELGALGHYTLADMPRLAVQIRQHLLSVRSKLTRLPAFGDYGIVYPAIDTTLDFRIIKIAPKIKYTHDEFWLVIKGRDRAKVPADQQTRRMCQDIVVRPEFAGNDHCWGCDWIQTRAAGGNSAGNPLIWLRAGTVHHLAVTVYQISNSLAF